MDDTSENAESAIGGNAAPGEDEMQGDAGGSSSPMPNDDEPSADADPPIVVQGGGKTGGTGGTGG